MHNIVKIFILQELGKIPTGILDSSSRILTIILNIGKWLKNIFENFDRALLRVLTS